MVMIALSTIFSALLIAACLSGIGLMISRAWPKLSAALTGPAPARPVPAPCAHAHVRTMPLRQAA